MSDNPKDILYIVSTRLFNLQLRSRIWIIGRERYDIGNDLSALMSDPHMQYPCGYWKDVTTLDDTQNAKLKTICERLQLRPGMRLPDIGYGWGRLVECAARHYSVVVGGVTVSKEQQKMAQQRCEGLNVNILLRDYRGLDKHYDCIVPVGTFEHVGPGSYDIYFSIADRCLKPGGLFLLHIIGSNKKGMGVDPWINKYISPNGCLSAIPHIVEASKSRFATEN